MSNSRPGSTDLAYSSIGDEVPIVTVPFESSDNQGINIQETPEESSKELVSSMVGWIVYKMYGIHQVKGVVKSYNSKTKLYEVHYKDGKSEKVTEDNLVRYLSPCCPEDDKQRRKAKPAIMNASNAGSSNPARMATKRKKAGTAAAKQSRQVSQGSGEVPAANSSKRAGTAAAKQIKQVPQGSGEVPAAKSGKRAGTAAAKQSKQASQGSAEVPAAKSGKRAGTAAAKQSKQASQGSTEGSAANSSNHGKNRYISLRMNASR